MCTPSRVLLLAVSLFVLIPAAHRAAAQSGHTVSGEILTGAGKALPGCEVSLQFAGRPTAGVLPPPSFAVADTGPDGRFFFKDVPAGTYLAVPRLLGFSFTPS